MIADNFAGPLSRIATKTFLRMKNPDKPSIQRIFVDNWEAFKTDNEVIRKGIRDIVTYEVDKMMKCGTLDSGFEIYECPNCHKSHIIAYTCKSRFCNSCGTKYAKQRAESISANTLNVSHRHMVFTIDEKLRIYFKKDRNLLNILFFAAKDTLFYTFNNMNGKTHTFKPGIILTLHTFGRALNWNPHIHCLVTEGGMDENNNYKKINYINYETLRKSYMKQVCSYLKEHFKDNPIELRKLTSLISLMYKKVEDGFYVHAPPMKDKKGKDTVVSYIIRYTGRPVMASSRIIDYDKHKKVIEYYYEDHKTEERIEVKEHIFDFMKKLIMHIPEAQFKMVRYYGLYATCGHHHKTSVQHMLNRDSSRHIVRKVTYRKDLIDIYNTDPFLCECGHYLEYIDYWVPPNRRKGVETYDTT